MIDNPKSAMINKVCRPIQTPVTMETSGGDNTPATEKGIEQTIQIEVLASSPALPYLTM
jgi:hypothetical protein